MRVLVLREWSDRAGIPRDQPAYDPLGDVWLLGKKTPAPVAVPRSLVSVEDRARGAQQEWNRRAVEWVARVKEQAKAT